MTELQEILRPGAVCATLSTPTKKALFNQLALIAEREYGIEAAIVVDKLTERERLGSTGFGGGIAIPHGKVDGLTGVVGIFVRLVEAVDFAAIDDEPVDLVFMLLSPRDAGAEHLKALAQISRMLRDRPFVAKLRGAATDDALFAIFSQDEARDAA